MGLTPPLGDTLLAGLITELADAVVVADTAGTICFWNRAAERVFGWTAGEAVGASLDLIIPERQRTRHWDGYRSVMSTGTTKYGSNLLACRHFTPTANAAPLPSPSRCSRMPREPSRASPPSSATRPSGGIRSGPPPAGAPINRLNRDVSVLELLEVPIVQAPMAGGPSTPALVAAVGGAGGLGFLGAGYLSPQRLSDDIDAVRRVFPGPFGVNVFVGGSSAAAGPLVDAYAREIASEAARIEVAPGVPRFDDDDFDAKVDLLCDDPVAVVSFTFGLPSARCGAPSRGSRFRDLDHGDLPRRGWRRRRPVAERAHRAGSGGRWAPRRSSSTMTTRSDLTLLAALQLIAPGGRVSIDRCRRTGHRSCYRCGPRGRRGVPRSSERRTCAAPRLVPPTCSERRLRRRRRTVLTRAFSGRLARGIENRFHRDHAASGTTGLPGGPPPDRAAAGTRSCHGRCRSRQPVGRPDPSARPSRACRPDHPDPRRRGAASTCRCGTSSETATVVIKARAEPGRRADTHHVTFRPRSTGADMPISADMPFSKQTVEVGGNEMAYVDVGEGHRSCSSTATRRRRTCGAT